NYPRRRQRPESVAAVPRNGDPSADALPGLCGLHHSVRIRPRSFGDALPGREVDPYHPPLDDGDLGISDLRYLPGRALGVFSAWMGRLLGLGPGRKRIPAALADRHRFLAFSHDAGETGHAESLEHVADLRHLPAVNFWNVP